MQVAMKKRNRVLLPLFPYPSWVRVVRCANGAPRASALVADSIICKLLPPFHSRARLLGEHLELPDKLARSWKFITVLTFEVQHIRTAAAGTAQQEK